jgi:hypothetical protein
VKAVVYAIEGEVGLAIPGIERAVIPGLAKF